MQTGELWAGEEGYAAVSVFLEMDGQGGGWKGGASMWCPQTHTHTHTHTQLIQFLCSQLQAVGVGGQERGFVFTKDCVELLH